MHRPRRRRAARVPPRPLSNARGELGPPSGSPASPPFRSIRTRPCVRRRPFRHRRVDDRAGCRRNRGATGNRAPPPLSPQTSPPDLTPKPQHSQPLTTGPAFTSASTPASALAAIAFSKIGSIRGRLIRSTRRRRADLAAPKSATTGRTKFGIRADRFRRRGGYSGWRPER